MKIMSNSDFYLVTIAFCTLCFLAQFWLGCLYFCTTVKKKKKKSMNEDKNNLFRSIDNDTEGSSGSGSLL